MTRAITLRLRHSQSQRRVRVQQLTDCDKESSRRVISDTARQRTLANEIRVWECHPMCVSCNIFHTPWPRIQPRHSGVWHSQLSFSEWAIVRWFMNRFHYNWLYCSSVTWWHITQACRQVTPWDSHQPRLLHCNIRGRVASIPTHPQHDEIKITDKFQINKHVNMLF